MDELRTHVFLDVATGEELVMPTYAQVGYAWRHGMGMETISLSELGDVAVPTVRTLCAEPLKVLLPAQSYPFNVPGANLNPWTYVEALERRADAKSVQRYIITGTPINAAVYIEEVYYTEPDCTGDLEVTIQLHEAKTPKAIPAASSLKLELGSREDNGGGLMASTYTVVWGDTMKAIARKFYGDANLCWRLAAYNNIPNANIINPGQVLKIPPRDQLPAASTVVKPRSAKVVEATTATYDKDAKKWNIQLKKEAAMGLGPAGPQDSKWAMQKKKEEAAQ